MILGEVIMDGCIWFGAPIMHMISGLGLVWHWHVVCMHVQLKCHSVIVCFDDMLFRWPTLVHMKDRVF